MYLGLCLFSDFQILEDHSYTVLVKSRWIEFCFRVCPYKCAFKTVQHLEIAKLGCCVIAAYFNELADFSEYCEQTKETKS